MTLVVAVSGLLFRDDFTRANGALGANWIVESGAWVIEGNRLKHTGVRNAQLRARLAAATFVARKDMVVQALVQRDDLRFFLDLSSRNDGVNFYYGQVAASDAGGGQANCVQLNRIAGATNLNMITGANAAPVAGVAQRLTMAVAGNVQRIWVNGGILLTANDASVANNVNGVGGLGSFGQPAGLANPIGWVDDYTVYASTVLTVTGLPAGYTVRVGALVSVASNGVDPVTLDCLGSFVPLPLVEILNAVGGVSDSSAAGIYGGSTLTYTPNAPDAPTIAAALVGAQNTIIRLTGSAYVHGGGIAQRSARWQVTAATDPAFLAPLYDSGDDLMDLGITDVVGMPYDTPLLARTRYEDVTFEVSPWSSAVAITIPKPILWTEVDLGPDVPGDIVEAVDTFVGLGPVGGLPRNNNIATPNVSGVYDGVEMTYDSVVVNPAGFAGEPDEAVQRDPGTSVPGPVPLTITFDQPIRGWDATIVQAEGDFSYMSAFDEHDILLDSIFFRFTESQPTTIRKVLNVGSNLIRKVTLTCEFDDWVAFKNFHMIRDHVNAQAGGWVEVDRDDGLHFWAEVDEAPVTGWSNG